MDKKVLVTGVSGMDGSLMADYLIENTDYFVIGAVRRLSVSNHKNIEHLKTHPRFRLIDLDVTDPVNVEQVVREEKPDYFINFAANSFVGNSWDMPTNHMTTNCMAVLYELEAIRKFIPSCRYYNAGSSEEWGDVSYSPQDEAHPSRPRSVYGASKVAARMLVKVYRESYNLFAIQGHLLNHEGPRRGHEFVSRKISLNVAKIKKSLDAKDFDFKPLELGNLEATRDWSNAECFVSGIWLMLNNSEPKEYVLSSNETHSVREFVELAFLAARIKGVWHNWSGKPEDEEYILADESGMVATKRKVTLVKINPKFYRPCEVSSLHGNSNLARKELGWMPKVSFQELVRLMVLHDLNLPNIP